MNTKLRNIPVSGQKRAQPKSGIALWQKCQRCIAAKNQRSSTLITRLNGCREGCRSRLIVHETMFPTRCWTNESEIFIKELFLSRSPELLRNSRRRKRQAMIMSASRSTSARVQEWSFVKTGLITDLKMFIAKLEGLLC